MKINNIAQFFRSKKTEIFEDLRLIGRSMILAGLLSAFAPSSMGASWLAVVLIGFSLWVFSLYPIVKSEKD